MDGTLVASDHKVSHLTAPSRDVIEWHLRVLYEAEDHEPWLRHYVTVTWSDNYGLTLF